MCGQDRGDREVRDQRIQVRIGPAKAPQPGDRVGDRVVQDAVAGGSLATAQSAHPAAGLGQVDQAEVEREGGDDRFGGSEVDIAQVLVEPCSLGGVVVLSQRDRASADALHEGEQLRAGLLGDHLAKQRSEQADLDRERVAGAGRTDPEGLGRDRWRGPSRVQRHAASPPFCIQAATRPQPSGHPTFPRLVS